MDLPSSSESTTHKIRLSDLTLTEAQLANWASEFFGRVLTLAGHDESSPVSVEFKDSADIPGFTKALLPFRRSLPSGAST